MALTLKYARWIMYALQCYQLGIETYFSEPLAWFYIAEAAVGYATKINLSTLDINCRIQASVFFKRGAKMPVEQFTPLR